MKDMIWPEALQPGDTIAIVSPATTVKPEYVAGAAERLHEIGYNVVVTPSAQGPAVGSYAAAEEVRLADILTALTDPAVKCIFCARGGYGCVHLLPHIPEQLIRENPKWLVGFSDISALHAAWLKSGVVSLHAPMAKHLTHFPPNHTPSDPQSGYIATDALLGILNGTFTPDYAVLAHPLNRFGEARGVLRGGNLAVLNGLAATPWDILDVKEGEDVILFIEDVSEAIYAVERMLIRLTLSGALRRVKGLIVGQFTEYRPDRNFDIMEQMIASLLDRCGLTGFPVVFGFPTGHVDYNLPLIEGSTVSLQVAPEGTILKTLTPSQQ